MRVFDRLERIYRRSGANLPSGDARLSHGAEMEGYFWRVTDVARQRVLVVLCGVNRHPDGDWATVAVAAHPGAFVRSTVLDGARAATDRFLVAAGDNAFFADEHHVHVDLGDVALDLELSQQVAWPLKLGAGGIFSAIPFLGQYWQPHVLGGSVTGTAHVDGDDWVIHDAQVYAEKNWGPGFPQRWWWGQAQGFERPDVCVAFAGGLLTAGPLSATVGGVIARVGADVIRLAPPLSIVRSTTDGHRWEVHGRGHGYRINIVGEAVDQPHPLPVPIPAQRRNVATDDEHLAARLTLEITGRLNFHGTSHWAALEIGHRPTQADLNAPELAALPNGPDRAHPRQ